MLFICLHAPTFIWPWKSATVKVVFITFLPKYLGFYRVGPMSGKWAGPIKTKAFWLKNNENNFNCDTFWTNSKSWRSAWPPQSHSITILGEKRWVELCISTYFEGGQNVDFWWTSNGFCKFRKCLRGAHFEEGVLQIALYSRSVEILRPLAIWALFKNLRF